MAINKNNSNEFTKLLPDGYKFAGAATWGGGQTFSFWSPTNGRQYQVRAKTDAGLRRKLARRIKTAQTSERLLSEFCDMVGVDLQQVKDHPTTGFNQTLINMCDLIALHNNLPDDNEADD